MNEDGNQPIIIRRKRVSSEEEHHGGVWKLAFADFMTAMMAFFLVMWLINSTSKETKATIVQYFNPVQLIDSSPAHKGLRDPKQTGQGKSPQQNAEPADEPNDATGAEAALHKEPMKALDKIAQRDPPPTAPATTPPRDPFDRLPKEMSTDAKPAQSDKARPAAAKLQSDIDKIVAHESRAPKVEVKQTDEGLLISLTDDANFSMFAVGSIEPKPQLVRIVGQIGKLLSMRPGEVELRGHTDARSYATKSYDNWRLSSDRATVANYMLTRGGLAPARVAKVVGFADRRLKNAQDPLAPVNRRIEILLRGSGG